MMYCIFGLDAQVMRGSNKAGHLSLAKLQMAQTLLTDHFNSKFNSRISFLKNPFIIWPLTCLK